MTLIKNKKTPETIPASLKNTGHPASDGLRILYRDQHGLLWDLPPGEDPSQPMPVDKRPAAKTVTKFLKWQKQNQS